MLYLLKLEVNILCSIDDVESGIIDSPEGVETIADDGFPPVETQAVLFVTRMSPATVGYNDLARKPDLPNGLFDAQNIADDGPGAAPVMQDRPEGRFLRIQDPGADPFSRRC